MTKATSREEVVAFYADGLRLVGTLHHPARIKRPAFVIGCHGLLSNRSSAKQAALAMACSQAGMAYFRFDHRGCGDSDGLFEAVTTYENRCRDLLTAIAALQRRTDMGDRIGLFGSSMGGAVCLGVAARVAVSAIVTLAAPVSLPPGAEDTKLPEHTPRLNPEFIDRLRFTLPKQLLPVSRLLVLHGDQDQVVPPSHAGIIYDAASSPKRLRMFEGGDHVISHPAHQKQLVSETVNWFSMWMDSGG